MKSVLAALLTVSLFVAGSAAADPLQIRESYVVPVTDWPTILFANPAIAKDLGKVYTFAPVHFQGTPQMIDALATGELEIANLTFSSLAIAIENADMKDLRVIADGFQDGVPGYLTGEDFVLKNSGIDKVEDLKGKVLASNATGAAVDIVLRVMLKKHGLDPMHDVTIIEAPFPAMPAMLTSHKVDLVVSAPPFMFDPNFTAVAKPLFTQAQSVGRTQMVIWVARESFIKAHRAALVDFMADTIREERWLLDPKNHDKVVALAAEISKQPAALWQHWLFVKDGEKGDFYRSSDAKPDLAALQNAIDLQAKMGFIKSSLDVKKYADLSLVEEAAKRVR